jgi:hypothetical protein
MKSNDSACSSGTTAERCDAELPDNPDCAPNYHFGMLLGVEDFRAEQGFHVGRMRRHQHFLHGTGVVAGYGVTFVAATTELRVAPGRAVDALGRDLVLERAQCVSLPLWWLEHRDDPDFHDVAAPDDATVDLDVWARYSCCLGSPVPAIAEPCAGDATDVAYSRICETVRLKLARTPAAPAGPSVGFHLLRLWLSLDVPRLDTDGKIVASDQWLLDRKAALHALAPAAQTTARSELLREVLARAVAETEPQIADPKPEEPEPCLLLARLRGVRIWKKADGWTATVGSVELGARDVLLPTSVLTDLLMSSDVAPLSGPVVIAGGATLTGSDVELVFDQPLASSSVIAGAFAVSEFVDAQGWKSFALAAVAYDESNAARPFVKLALDRAPAGKLVRTTVVGSGSTPLLARSLIPAGAVSPDGDGQNLSISILRG